MIRVAQIIASGGYGGAEQHFCTLSRLLDQRRFEVFGICPRDARYIPELRLSSCRVIPLAGRLLTGGLVPLLRLLRRLRVEVVHTHLMAGESVGIPAALLARVPVIVSTVHGYNYWYPHHRGWRRLRYRLASHLYRLRYVSCDAVIAVSAGVAHDLVHRPGIGLSSRKIHVIPNGVDVDRFARVEAPPAGGTPPVVLTVANFQPGKGHEVLIDAASRVRARFPSAEFWLVGDGPERARIASRARAAGIAPAVRFLGARQDIPDLLAAATIVAVPSDLEGFGMAAIEALAAGRPVVATAAGGLAEILEHDRTALLVPPHDPEHLARAIGSLLADEPRRQAMSARARADARERFGLRPWIRRMEALYEELARARSITAASAARDPATEPGARG